MAGQSRVSATVKFVSVGARHVSPILENEMSKQCNSSLPRREFLCAAGMASMTTLLPRMSLAYADTDSRFVFIILRGALDGLAAVAPYGDGNYQRVRGALALPAPGTTNGALKLDGMFALNPALKNLYQRYQAKELLVMHAVASPYRDRSHFDGQDLLENGTIAPHGSIDGWLNRALSGMSGSRQRSTDQLAIAFAQNVPLVLRGEQKVGSWVPSRLPETDDDTLQRIAALYQTDPYFLSRLQTAMATDAIAGEGGMDMTNHAQDNGQGIRNNPLAPIVGAAGKMLRQSDGPRIAVMEATGWDTHANQGAEQGQLFARLEGLDQAIDTLRIEMDDAWKNTVVMVATEFGRTAAINGTRGTDHGTATCSFLVGGAVNGGKVIADWPGLASNNMYQGRDLQPTMDLRSVFKGVLATHMGVSDSVLENRVFADSRNAKPMLELVQKA
jgi:uncharacterized protein (DUF1501 family)